MPRRARREYAVPTGTETFGARLTALLPVGDFRIREGIGGPVETPRFRINTFPSDDEDLARFVAGLAGAVSQASEGAVAWLESTLRERYPYATVAERSELADMFPTEPLTLYVYRDGSPLSAPRV